MKKDKEMNLDELEQVSGGVQFKDSESLCPKCKKTFDSEIYYVTYGSGCDEKKYKKCPYCGCEFE